LNYDGLSTLTKLEYRCTIRYTEENSC